MTTVVRRDIARRLISISTLTGKRHPCSSTRFLLSPRTFAAAATSRQKKKGVAGVNHPLSADGGTRENRLILPPPSPHNLRTSLSSLEGDSDESNPLIYDDRAASFLQHTIPTLPRNWSGYEPATPLWNHLAMLISIRGRPLSVRDYMRLCLTHPEFGYYTTNTKDLKNRDMFDDDDDNDDAAENDDLKDYMIGRDFVTAPEISQVFGECLAVWFRTQWDKQQQQQQKQQTACWQWVECGPGKGTLMADLARASFPLQFGEYCRYIHLIEASPVLRAKQREELQRVVVLRDNNNEADSSNDQDQKTTDARVQFEFVNDVKTEKIANRPVSKPGTIVVIWHDKFDDFVRWQQRQQSTVDNNKSSSPLMTFVVCQEFVDALPVYSFQKTNEGWRERMIDLAIMEDEEDDVNVVSTALVSKKPRLRVVLAPEVTPPLKTLLQVDEHGWILGEDPISDIGSILEVNPEGILLVQDIAEVISNNSGGGAALIIDYGHEGSTDSIRAFARHQQVPFLSQPGLVDVTADVDFCALRHAVNNNATNSKKPSPGGQAQAYGPVTQGVFLMAMGLQERVLSVIEHENTDEENAENLYHAMVRLASPDEMGERFKVLAIVKKEPSSLTDPPPGFD